jgi:hypothetical protein
VTELAQSSTLEHKQAAEDLTLKADTNPTAYIQALAVALTQDHTKALRKNLSHFGAVGTGPSGPAAEAAKAALGHATTWVELSPDHDPATKGTPADKTQFRVMWDVGNTVMGAFVHHYCPTTRNLTAEHAGDIYEAALALAYLTSVWEANVSAYMPWQLADTFHGKLAQTIRQWTPPSAGMVYASFGSPSGVAPPPPQSPALRPPAAAAGAEQAEELARKARKQDKKDKKKAKKEKKRAKKEKKKARSLRGKSSSSSTSTSTSTAPEASPRLLPPPEQPQQQSRDIASVAALLKEVCQAQLQAITFTCQAYRALLNEPMDIQALTEDRTVAAAVLASQLGQGRLADEMIQDCQKHGYNIPRHWRWGQAHGTDATASGPGGTAADGGSTWPANTTSPVYWKPPRDPAWPDFMQIYGEEALIKAGAAKQPKPEALWNIINDRTSETLLMSIRVGRPFSLGTTCDFYHPIIRVHKLLRTLLGKYQPTETEKFGDLTPEMTLGLLLHAWEARHGQSPFEILILPDPKHVDQAEWKRQQGNDRHAYHPMEMAFVRAKQDLIRDRTLASDGGPARKTDQGQQQLQPRGMERSYSSFSWGQTGSGGNGDGNDRWQSQTWNK